MNRRHKGDGGLCQAMHNGKQQWRATWMQDGKLRVAYGDTQSDALNNKMRRIQILSTASSSIIEAKPIKAHKQNTIGNKNNPTVKQLMDRWLDSKTAMSDLSIKQYRNNMKNHIIPIIGDKAIKQVSDVDIIEIIEHMQANNVGKSAMRNALKKFNSLLNYAIKIKIITVNPFKYVEMPTAPTVVADEDNRMIGWRTTVILDLLAEMENETCKYYDSYPRIMMMMLGIRGGELVGLTWDCIDFINNKITIKQQQQLVDGHIRLKRTTKNKKDRKIPLVEPFRKALIIEMLKERKQTTPLYDTDGKEINNFIFIRKDGKPYTYQMHYYEWQKIMQWYLSEIDGHNKDWKQLKWRPHYNRHICASLMAKQNVPLAVAQEILGHMDKEMTEWYTHLYQPQVVEGTQQIGNVLINNPMKQYNNFIEHADDETLIRLLEKQKQADKEGRRLTLRDVYDA